MSGKHVVRDSDILTLMMLFEEYSESVFDKDNNDPIWLHVFGKEINKRLIYIKLKIRESNCKRVICVSFHYAKNNMFFPYRRL